MRSLSEAVRAVAIAIATSGLLDMVTDVVNFLAELVRILAQTNPELFKWGTIIAGLAAAIGPVLVTLGLMATGIAAISAPVALVVAGIVGLTAAVVAFWPEIERATAAVVQFAQDVTAALMALPGQMYQIGVDIMTGLWNGMKSLFGTIRDGVSSLASDYIVGPLKGLLGIHSPSRVLHAIGVNIMEGLAGGIGSMTGAVQGGVEKVASTIEGAFSGIGTGIAEAIKGTKSWKDVALDAIRSIGRALLQNMNFGGGMFGSIFKSLLGGLVGFQHGGSFTVGGTGGTDSQLVAFRATPGEMVDVRKGGQGRHGGVQEIVVRGVFVDDGGVVKGIAMEESASASGRVARAVPSIALGAMDTSRTRKTRTISPAGGL
jgi:phage-related protein